MGVRLEIYGGRAERQCRGAAQVCREKVIERGPKCVLKIRLREKAPKRPRRVLGNAQHVPVTMSRYTSPFLGGQQPSLGRSND